MVELFLCSCLYVSEILVNIKFIVCDLKHTSGDIGAVVGYSLEVCEDICENESKLDCALALTETLNVALTEKLLKMVYNLLERLYDDSLIKVIVGEAFESEIKDLIDCTCKSFKLALCLSGEFKLLIVNLLSACGNVKSMVGDTLEVADNVEKLVCLKAIALVHILACELNEI